MARRASPSALLALGGLLVACGRTETPSASGEPRLRPALEERSAELDPRTTNVGTLVPDLAFTDVDGRAGRLSDFRGRALVIAVRDVGCPVSMRTSPELARIEDEFRPRGVAFLFLNLSAHNTSEEIRDDAAVHGFDSPNVHDVEQTIGTALEALTTTEVFVLDGSRTLVYRGAIDDRVGRGVVHDAPRHPYLREALASVLDHGKVQVAATSAPGCLLGLEARPRPWAEPTYHHQVARILRDNCVECHRSGGVAPFALETLAQTRGRKAMLSLVVEDRIMPPWFAAEGTGPWRNDRRLSESDRETLLAWIEGGAPEGDPAEAPLAYVHPDGWSIGEPDLVLEMKEAFQVPAEAPVGQRYFEVTPEVPADLWLQRLEIRPTAPEVVHHVTVSYRPPARGAAFEKELRHALLPWSRRDNEGWVFLFFYLPGKGPQVYPDGIAPFLPKGSRLRFDMHYTPKGTSVLDRTRLGLVLAKEPPELVAECRNFWNQEIDIPPMEPNAVFTREFPIQHDVLLRSLTPHMHLRGRSMVADLVVPGGETTRLIDVPAWDQDWQFNYVFREPRFAPAGSRVRVTASFDNSPGNPSNPDPHARVKDGPLITDEMMSLIVEWIRPRLRE